MVANNDRVWIFDTTLRDGDQALSASLSQAEKVQVAHAIARLNVDVMEVGFPVSSPGDFAAVSQIAREVKGPVICGLARAVAKDIEACGEALKDAENRRIHIFIATSPIHLQNKLKMSLSKANDMAVAAIKLASRYTDDIEFSCEDAARTPYEDLNWIIERVIDAGATTINIPDTVGYTTPMEYAKLVRNLMDNVPNIDKARISVHGHNDLGLAVANSIAAVAEGARQIECTINGIGERAGNCAMEEVAMILATRKDLFNLHTQLNCKEIYRTSRLVSQVCNMPIQANKAIVGQNAFAHSSGIHQDGMLKASNTYEIMSPDSIGKHKTELNLTSRSGRHVIKNRLETLGYGEDEYDLENIYAAFVKLADQKGQVQDYDLEALLHFSTLDEQTGHKYQVDFVNIHSNSSSIASATVALLIDGEQVIESATGNGAVDAAFHAIHKITDKDIKITEYHLDAKGSGADALGEVNVVAEYNSRKFHGAGLATDIVESSVRAFVHVLNLCETARKIEDIKQENLGGI
ncbi:MAG: 2-isopropylmalate synthase [Algicola sp.]|nr:2-isopropylmalate synthase [Algicola sp.]